MKYNWSIIGHEKQLERIESDIESGNLAHAYLLAGPNSVGKHTVARKFAGILQCENDFCHKCPTCLQIEKGSHVDTAVFRGRKESILIADVRGIIDRANKTGQSRYKIFLIQSVERMTPAAANSFLKVLEEPPMGTIFILTTNNIRALLPTIVSRVRVLKFGNVSAEYLAKKLSELYPDQDEKIVKQVSLLSMGKTGKAVNLIENPDSLANYLKVYSDVQGFLERDSLVDRFSYVGELVLDDKQMEIFLNMLTHVLRSKVLSGEKGAMWHISTLSKIEEAGIFLKGNINSRLVLENLMLNL